MIRPAFTCERCKRAVAPAIIANGGYRHKYPTLCSSCVQLLTMRKRYCGNGRVGLSLTQGRLE